MNCDFQKFKTAGVHRLLIHELHISFPLETLTKSKVSP